MHVLCKAHIDLAALQANLAKVSEYAPHCKIIAMVKANGYGHGLIQVAQALQQASALGVARMNEGLELRDAGITQPIVLCEGFTYRDELPLLTQYNFTVVLHQLWQLDLLEKTPLKHPVKVWIKVDTGMHRLGFFPSEVPNVHERLAHCPWVDSDIGIMSHFAEAEFLENPTTQQQADVFAQVRQKVPGPASLANSAAIMAWPKTHWDWVRPGIMLYGISPFMAGCGIDWGLKPVMTLTSEIIAVRQGRKGDAIGYGGTWICPEDMPIGVVAVGYGDGYPRYIKNEAPVLVGQIQVPLIGRVSMDMVTVDLRACPDTKIGTPVTLWGKDLPVETIARWANTSPYELVCGITKRVLFT